jgi:hypothetical protein
MTATVQVFGRRQGSGPMSGGALRAMAVAARVIGDLRVGTLLVLAARDVAAERRGHNACCAHHGH